MGVTVMVPNALGPESAAAFLEHTLDALGQAQVVVFRGGAVFCSGVSLQQIASVGDHRAPVTAYARALEAILLAPVPTLCAVEGPAVGGGVGIAAAADHTLAIPRATFAMPELLYGLLPVVVLPSLRRRLNAHAIVQFAGTGSSQSAELALAAGLVDGVVAEEELDARLLRLETQMTRTNFGALRTLREELLNPKQLREQFDRAIELTVARLLEPEVQRKIRAFVEEGAAPWTSA